VKAQEMCRVGDIKKARGMFEELFKDLSGKLHPQHAILFNAYAQLVNCCDAMNDINSSIK
jgi:hypothetical protein